MAPTSSSKMMRQTSNAYVLSFPKGLGGLAIAAFRPERNNCTPSESNSEVKKGFQGSGSSAIPLDRSLTRRTLIAASFLR
jgi:hypothetical protein